MVNSSCLRRCATALVALLTITVSNAENWPQFRGRDGRGISTGSSPLPVNLGPDSPQLAWKVKVARGHSSPVVWDDRVLLTSFDGRKLLTIAMDLTTGKEIWNTEAPWAELERIHKIGSHATSSVATDGEVVVSFFGSSGLHCYSFDGRLLWSHRMGPFNNQFGATSSPILVDDRIVLLEDHDTGSFLAVFDKHSGRELWRVDRPNFRRNYGSPCLWDASGRKQIVIPGSAQVVAYDLENGNVIWTIRGVARVVNTTPVSGDDGDLYLATTGGSETEQPVFAEVLQTSDADNSGTLEPDELPKSPIRSFFDQFDRDANGSLDQTEYNSIRDIFSMSRTVAMRVKPGGRGDITDSHVVWTTSQSVPRNASPLVMNGAMFLVKDGGIATSLDVSTGEILRRGRLADGGKYYASPVAGDGKIYACSERGRMTVVSAEPEWSEIARSDFGEDIYATPAIAGGRILVRTVATLYCFGDTDSR